MEPYLFYNFHFPASGIARRCPVVFQSVRKCPAAVSGCVRKCPLVGDRTFKLPSGTTSEPGRYARSLGEPRDGIVTDFD